MTFIDVLIVIFAAFVVAWAIVSVFRKKKKGGGCGGCSGCPHASACPSKQKEKSQDDQ